MDKYDYITVTVEEEKIRVEKILAYLKDNPNIEEEAEYLSRYNNICKYLNAKEEYQKELNSINLDKERLEELNNTKDENEVDNILLEDTLLNKFNEDTNHIYEDISYEDIKKENKEVSSILSLLLRKESSYQDIVSKREHLKEILDANKYKETYNTLNNQSIIIERQSSILGEIFTLNNRIKVKEEKLKQIEDSIMVPGILKILYEFWIIDSYDKNKVNRNKLFKDNKTFISIKEKIQNEREETKPHIENLNLPGLDEDTTISIDGKNYVKNDE